MISRFVAWHPGPASCRGQGPRLPTAERPAAAATMAVLTFQKGKR